MSDGKGGETNMDEVTVDEAVTMFMKFFYNKSSTLYSNIFEETDLQLLCDSMYILKVGGGDMVMRKGDDASFSCLILDGRVRIGNGARSFPLGTGELIGSESYFHKAERTIDVSADTGGVTLLILKYDDIEALAMDPHTFDLYIKVNKVLATNSISVLRKVLQSTTQNKDREKTKCYNSILETLMSDSVITDKEHELLTRVRKVFHMDEKQHTESLKAIGKSVEEFNSQIQSQGLQREQKYRTLLSTLIQSGQISKDDEKALKLSATENEITEDKHLLMLGDMGISASQFKKLKNGNREKQLQIDMYKRVLAAFTADSCLTPDQVRELREFREQYHLTEEESKQVMADIGLTDTKYKDMITKGKKKAKQNKNAKTEVRFSKTQKEETDAKNNMETYQRVLTAFLADGMITENEKKELERLRNQFNITMDLHNQALYDLGSSPSKFQELLRKGQELHKNPAKGRHDYQKQAKMELLFTSYVKKQEEHNKRQIVRLKKKHADAQRERVNQSYTLETMKFKLAKLQSTNDNQQTRITRIKEDKDELQKKLNTSLWANQTIVLQLDDHKKWKSILENEKAGLTAQLEELTAKYESVRDDVGNEMKNEYEQKYEEFRTKTGADAVKVSQFLAGSSQVQMDYDEAETKRLNLEKKSRALEKTLMHKDFELDKMKENLHSVEHHANFLEQKLLLTKDAHQHLIDEHVELKRQTHEWEEYAKVVKSKLRQNNNLFSIIVQEKVRFKRILTHLCVNFFVKTYKSGKILKKVLLTCADQNHKLQTWNPNIRLKAPPKKGSKQHTTASGKPLQNSIDSYDPNPAHAQDADATVMMYRKKRKEAENLRIPRTHGLQDAAQMLEQEFVELIAEIKNMKDKVTHWQATSKVFFERNLELVNLRKGSEKKMMKLSADNQNLRLLVEELRNAGYSSYDAHNDRSSLHNWDAISRKSSRGDHASVVMSPASISRTMKFASKNRNNKNSKKKTFPIIPGPARREEPASPYLGLRIDTHDSRDGPRAIPHHTRVASIPEFTERNNNNNNNNNNNSSSSSNSRETNKRPSISFGSPDVFRLKSKSSDNTPDSVLMSSKAGGGGGFYPHQATTPRSPSAPVQAVSARKSSYTSTPKLSSARYSSGSHTPGSGLRYSKTFSDDGEDAVFFIKASNTRPITSRESRRNQNQTAIASIFADNK